MRTMGYRRPQTRFSLDHAILSLAIGLAIFALSLAVFLIGSQVWFAGRILPGVQIAGADVGGLRPQEAALHVAQTVVYPQQGKIVLRDGERMWVVTPAELGLYIDPMASANTAYAVGRTGWILDRLKTQYYVWSETRNITPNFVFDERAAVAYLNQLSKEINTPTVEATLQLNGTEVIMQPGQVGRTLDMTATLAAIANQIKTIRDGVIDLPVHESAPVILDASQEAERTRAMLSQPLTLTLPEPEAAQAGPWTIDQNTLATMLAFERVETETGAQYQVRVDSEALRAYLNGFAPGLERSPQNARFIFNDDTRQLEAIQPSTIGRRLDLEASVQAIQEKLAANEHTIPLTMVYTDPPVTDQARGEDIGITELMYAETSYFYGSSASRVQNIEAAASKFHGLLIAPGETFSMASALGDITLDNGYAEALIIVGGQTVKGVGGGVCQVSTTLFRTAFFAGLPIVERHAHAYRVYYYEKEAGNRIDPTLAGLDATVFVPIVDFKFTNDTPYWILMETYVSPSNSSITWKFYSTKDGRQVSWDTTGPMNVVPAPDAEYRENPDLAPGEIKQIDWQADGADVTVTRTVYKNDSVYLQDTIYTHYEAWADVYEYGPGTELPSDEPEPPEG